MNACMLMCTCDVCGWQRKDALSWVVRDHDRTFSVRMTVRRRHRSLLFVRSTLTPTWTLHRCHSGPMLSADLPRTTLRNTVAPTPHFTAPGSRMADSVARFPQGLRLSSCSIDCGLC